MSCDVGIGDVIVAWRAIGADTDDERRAIARLLGFDLRDAGSAPADEPARPVRPPREPRGPTTPSNAAIELPPPPAGAPTRIDLVPFTDAAANPFALPSDGLALPVEEAPSPIEPLFDPRWKRSIVGSLSKRLAPVGEIDHAVAIERIVRREPIGRLPRRPRLVSVTEVIVAIDTRSTLAWFAADAAELVARLDAITRAHVAVVETDGAPVLSHSTEEIGIRYVSLDDDDDDDEDDGPPAEPPPDRIRIGADGRVIGVTDLGLGSPWSGGDPRRLQAWIALAASMRSRGASLVIITPVPLERIPARLRRLAACVWWDRATRPSAVNRQIKVRR